MPGKTRSLSVMARPQVGQATQAIDQRRTSEMSSDSGTRCLRRTASRPGLSAALIPVLIGRFQEYLAALQLSGRDGDIRVGVAIEEALLNALFHGNLEVGSELRLNGDAPFHALANDRRHQSPYKERKIHVTSRISGSEATFVIRDEGPGFRVSKLPDPTDLENLGKPSGRGVMLMRTFMTEVTFNELGNQVTLIKRKSKK